MKVAPLQLVPYRLPEALRFILERKPEIDNHEPDQVVETSSGRSERCRLVPLGLENWNQAPIGTAKFDALSEGEGSPVRCTRKPAEVTVEIFSSR